jgi:hypothetical protein
MPSGSGSSEMASKYGNNISSALADVGKSIQAPNGYALGDFIAELH